MRYIILFLILGLSGIAPAHEAEQLYTEQPMLTPDLARPGKWPVGVTTITATNPGQLSAKDFSSINDRILPLEIWYPGIADPKARTAVYKSVTRSHQPYTLQGTALRDLKPASGQAFPLIVLSHGYTGYRTLMFYLGEHFASHGYVVAAMDHTDSTNTEVDFATNPGGGFPSTLLNRARDQQFVLEHLASLDDDLGKIINTDLSAVIGYSMGGYGAINTVGGCYNFSTATLMKLQFPEQLAGQLGPLLSTCNAGRDTTDPRWKAMIAIAPWGQEHNIHVPESLAGIKVPSLYIAGEYDDISGYEHGVRKLFEQTGAETNYMLLYKHARHNIGPHPAPRVAYANELDLGLHAEPSWSSEMLNRINQHIGLAFLDCHIKQIAERCAFLPKRTSITQHRLPDGEYTPPWPGFGERWGTGVEFHRSN